MATATAPPRKAIEERMAKVPMSFWRSIPGRTADQAAFANAVLSSSCHQAGTNCAPGWSAAAKTRNRRDRNCACKTPREMAQVHEFDFVIINELFDRALFDLKPSCTHSVSSILRSAAPAQKPSGTQHHLIFCSPSAKFGETMARITVEDCLEQIPNRFQLVLAATYRASMLSQGHSAKSRARTSPA
jgi:hypothetical protein